MERRGGGGGGRMREFLNDAKCVIVKEKRSNRQTYVIWSVLGSSVYVLTKESDCFEINPFASNLPQNLINKPIRSFM